jgi:hypothetical protein
MQRMNGTLPPIFLAANLALGFVAYGQSSAADAIPPPPDNCPPGQVGHSSHSGAKCVPKSGGKGKDSGCATVAPASRASAGAGLMVCASALLILRYRRKRS